jgi:hypothetical protein
MSQRKRPDPNRFIEYKVSKDGKSFEIPSGEIFYFDEYGGWLRILNLREDEYGNIYNANGEPEIFSNSYITDD